MLRRLAILGALASLLVGAPWAAAVGTPPPVEAAAYIVVDPATGETLAQRAPDRELPMASTTKIMTALVVLEATEPDELMTVPPEATVVGESSGGLVAGETLTVRELLTALLVPSGNDAAVTLAVGVGGSQEGFVELMNQKAQALGLEHTSFANPHGLDAPGHHSSVRDLVTMAQEAMKDPLFREIVAQREATIPGPGDRGTRTYVSENTLLDIDPEADGVKTGMTDDAGFSLVAHSRRKDLGGVDLYTAIIGAPSSDVRAQAADALLSYGFRQFARATLLGRDEVVGQVPVDDKPGTQIPYRAERPLVAALRLDDAPVTQTLEAPTELSGPVAAGDPVGTITFRQGDRVLGTRALLATRSASAPSMWDRFRAGIGSLL